MKNIRKFLLLTVIITLLSTACSNLTDKENSKESNTENKEITVVDMTGREVKIKKPIKNFIVNQWDLGEVISMIVGKDYENMLKGVGTSGSSESFQKVYGDELPGLKDMAFIGGGGQASYDLETIIKIQPDVFFINSRGSFLKDRQKDIEDLEKAGIPVFIFTLGEDAINSPLKGIEIIGELFDNKEKAKEINEFIQTQFDLIESRLSKIEDRALIYYEHSKGADRNNYGSTTINGGWATIINKARGHNISIDIMNESGKIAPEYLLKTNPDFVLFSTALGYLDVSNSKAPKLINEAINRTGWDGLNAVKNKEVHALFHDHSRTPFAFYPTLYLAKTFYPELMEDVNPDAILEEFYSKFMLVKYEDGTWSYKLGEE